MGTVRRMVNLLYTGQYDVKIAETSRSNTGDDATGTPPPSASSSQDCLFGNLARDDLLCHIRMSSISNLLDIQKLRELANSRMKQIFQDEWTPESFPEVVRYAWSSTGDASLHGMIASTAAEHIVELIKTLGVSELADIWDLVMETLEGYVSQIGEDGFKFSLFSYG
ncbi:hypothetical protein EDB80DRAFT_682707 [Ilyonectria destructans]|nr:hypothetical protein EDB80DRAFT_682707 [Ilyonectria destructans]